MLEKVFAELSLTDLMLQVDPILTEPLTTVSMLPLTTEDEPPVLEATWQAAPTKRNSTALKGTAQKSDQDQVVQEDSSGSIAVPPQRVKQSEVSNNAPTGSVMCKIVNNLLCST